MRELFLSCKNSEQPRVDLWVKEETIHNIHYAFGDDHGTHKGVNKHFKQDHSPGNSDPIIK